MNQDNAKPICFAESEKYGKIVIKRNKNKNFLRSEYQALIDFAGERCCSVYEFNEKEGLLLEERILPGSTLRQERSFQKRMDEFAGLFLSIHPVGTDRTYNTYLQWIKNAVIFCESDQNANRSVNFPSLFRAGKTMIRLTEALFKKHDSVLLHGDLHHDNILKRSDGVYCMIDPKGVMGPAVFDVGRFLLNEIDCAIGHGKKEHITKAVQILGEKLSFSEKELFQVLYIEAWLACVWDLEDGNLPEAFGESFILAEGLYEETLWGQKET